MEKIKAALAKVNSEKKKPLNKPQKQSETVVKEKRNIDKNTDISEITYTNTKVIKLDSKVLEENRIVSHLSHNANASIIDSLRTQVLQKMDENNWQSIAVVSPTANSGKSLLSINLAMSIARQPQKTSMLIDFDLRKPKVASYLGLNVDLSLNEYLENKAAIEDILVNPSMQRLVVMPTMRPITSAAEELSSSKVSQLIEELKARYDSRVLVYDLPPLLSVDDAMVVIPRVDCVLMVVANGESTADEIEDALRLVPKNKLVGVVYNKANEDLKNYYY